MVLAVSVQITSAQTQSIVIQKNTLPDANQNFSFGTSGPAGSAFASNPVLTLNNPYGGKQPLEIGASSSVTAGTGYLAFTQNDASVNEIFTYHSGDASWTDVANTALYLDYKSEGTLFFIGTNYHLYEKNGATITDRYTNAYDVGTGPDDNVYFIGWDKHIYRYDGPGSFSDLGGSNVKRLDGGPSGSVWYIGGDNHIYTLISGNHTDRGLAPGNTSFTDLSVGADGKAWALGINPANATYNILYYWNGSAWIADALAPTGTTMNNIAVGADGEPLVTLSFNGGRTYLLKRLSDGRWIEISAQLSGNNNTLIFYNQPSGSYSFTETVAPGYYLQDIIIFGTTGDFYSTTTGTTNINLSTGEHAYVQYTNVSGTKPPAQTIASACGSTFNEDFGTVTPGTVNSLPTGQTTFSFNSNPMGHYQGNGTNDGQYDVVSSVFDATGYYYQWISGPGVSGASCSYTCDIHGGGTKNVSDHDHTGNVNGGMLLVNSDFTSGVYYEKEYAGLVPGNSYQFSAWVANILLSIATDATDPNVVLRVVDPTTGHILLDLPSGDIPKTGSTLTWLQKKGSFIAPASGNVKVYLINNKPGGQGNDLVLDDISLTATCQTISGTILNDANGLTDGLVNGTGTNTANPFYVVLVDASNQIVSSLLLPADGKYSFTNLFSGTYSIKITTTVPGTAGSIAPDAALTNGWLNTGDSLGTNNANGTGFIHSGNMDSIRVQVGVSDVTGVDFGIERAPVANDVTDTGHVNPGGTNTVMVPVLNGSDPEQGILPGTGKNDTVKIISLPTNAILYYNGTVVTAGQVINNYDPALLTIDPDDGLITVIFTYSEVDAAQISSTPAKVTIPFTSALPVKLGNFSGKANDGKADLCWSVLSEINTTYYEIEKSSDGIYFEPIGRIHAKASETNQIVYTLTDSQPLKGNNYYRIKIVDRDGSISYSNIITVNFNKTSVAICTVKPNPFISSIDTDIELMKTTLIKVYITDASGKLVYQKNINCNKGANHINLNNLGELSSGIYILNVLVDNTIVRERLVKIKK